MTDEYTTAGDAAEPREKATPRSVVMHEFIGVTHEDVANCLQYWRERLHAAIRQPMNFGPGDIEYIAQNIERLHDMTPEEDRDNVCRLSIPFSGERPPSPA